MSFKFYGRSGHGIMLGTTMCLEGLKTTKNPSGVSGSQRRGLNPARVFRLNTVPPENETPVSRLNTVPPENEAKVFRLNTVPPENET
jgi:hypothetical protein